MAKKVNIGQKPSSISDATELDQWVSTPRALESTESQSLSSTPEPVKMKRLTLDIPEDLHKAIKTRAVVEGVPMANMLRSLLEEHYGNQ
jgi:predicted DNA binding CopG/RHH family protein